MQPYRIIYHTDRRSYNLSMRQDEPNTLTHQYDRVQTTPPGNHSTAPLHGILTGHRLTLHCVYVYVFVYAPAISTNITIDMNTMLLRQDRACWYINSPTRAPP